MLNINDIKRSLAKISPYPWRFDGVGVVDARSKPVAQRKRFKSVEAIDAVFIASAPSVITQLVIEVERLHSEIYDECEVLEFARKKIKELKAERDAVTVELNNLKREYRRAIDAIQSHYDACNMPSDNKSSAANKNLWAFMGLKGNE